MTPVVLHSITRVEARHRGTVVASGSHGGRYAAAVAARAGVAAVLFNDASGGRDDAGIAGVHWLDRYRIAAAAVSHLSAPIGDGDATLHSGVLSVVNATALARGCRVGQPAIEAVRALRVTIADPPPPAAGTDADLDAAATEARYVLREAGPGRLRVVALDSVSLVTPADRDSIVVTGSHGALLGGEPASALKVDTRGAVYNDAGLGPDGRGSTRLPELARRGIPAVTVAASSARIGDGRSTYDDGVITVVNEPAARIGVRAGASVPEFIALVDRSAAKLAGGSHV